MQTLQGYRVNVTRHFAGGGSVTNEIIIYQQTGLSGSSVEVGAYEMDRQHAAVPTALEQRRVTSIDYTYVGLA
jgi:hypothetical protein